MRSSETPDTSLLNMIFLAPIYRFQQRPLQWNLFSAGGAIFQNYIVLTDGGAIVQHVVITQAAPHSNPHTQRHTLSSSINEKVLLISYFK